MAKMPKKVIDFFKDPLAAKVIATIDGEGHLNSSPKGSLVAVDEETLAYADLYGAGSRTYNNLLETGQTSMVAYKVTSQPPFTAYQVLGTFDQSFTSGPIFDAVAGPIVAIGMEVKAVNTIKADAVYSESPTEPGKRLA